MNKTRKIGADLVRSWLMTSMEPETALPTASAKQYKAFMKLKAEMMKKTIRRMDTTNDCLLCF